VIQRTMSEDGGDEVMAILALRRGCLPEDLVLCDGKNVVANERRAGSFFAECQRDEHGYCVGGEHIATPKELRRAQRIAQEKAAVAPVPTPEEKAAVEGIARLGANLYRRNLVGNTGDRHKRRQALLEEFGDGHTCPCVYCGLRLAEGTLEQDKIHTTAEGGRYRKSNLVPSCSSCNKQRGDIPWSKIEFTK
jgi:hypothetical protein